ncbi:hypothetical protein LZC95_09370 [Pendulispora brunnea]|uniref:Metal-dependent hydrolase n=1 Tax=Pendulispora brunnea TaxID=2905690 RepID=A0ABZ2KIA0_9BACT
MHAAHLAAGLVIKSRVPEAPTAALLIGVFVPDFVWTVLALAGVEPTKPGVFFDDWSHSLAMCMLWASLFSLWYRARGRRVAMALWIAVMSHFVLDMPFHPKDLALYPHSSLHLGWGLSGVGPLKSWWIQLAVVVALSFVYIWGALKTGMAWRKVAWSAGYVSAFHILMMPL